MPTLSFPLVNGGMNDSLFSTMLARSQVRFSKNNVLSLEGVLTQRGGTVLVSDTATGSTDKLYGTHGYYVHESDGTITRRTMIKAGSVLYEFNATTLVFDVVQAGCHATNKPSMENFTDRNGNEVLIYADGELFFMYDGTTVTTLTPPPEVTGKPRYLATCGDALWVAGSLDDPSLASFSDDLDPQSFHRGYNFRPGPGDGDRITGLKSMRDGLAITKDSSIHLIVGTDANDYRIEKISQDIGASSHWSLQAMGRYLFFANPGGIWVGRLIKGDKIILDTERISGNVQNRYNDITVGTHQNIPSVYDENAGHIVWGIQKSTSDYFNEGLVFSLWHSDLESLRPPIPQLDTRFAWAGFWSGIPLESIGRVRDSNNVDQVYFGGNDGLLRRYNTILKKDSCAVGETTGTGIVWEVRPYEVRFGDQGVAAIVHRILPLLFQRANSTIQCSWIVDQKRRLPTSGGSISPITVKFFGNVPYRNNGSDSSISTRWGSTIWKSRPILQAQVSVGLQGTLAHSFLPIFENSGTHAKSENAFAGFSLEITPVRARGRG